MKKKKISAKAITYIALLVAVEIVLNRFLSFNVWNMKIGFSFIPVVLSAFLFGPIIAGAVAALGDFLGAILFPIGPYFPGFTAVAFIAGVIYGIFLHRSCSMSRTILAATLVQIVCTLLLNTWNIAFLNGVPFLPQMSTRLVEAGALFVLEVVMIPAVCKIGPVIGKRVSLA